MTGTSAPPSLIEVGRVSKAHGIRGELRVVLHWENSDALSHVRRVFLASRGGLVRAFDVRTARFANRAVLLTLAGVGDRNQAEALRGATVSVERSDLPALEQGEYYLCDLVGASVFAPSGLVGEVVEVRVHPSVDALVIRAPDGAFLEQPIAEPWISSVDVSQKRIELTSTDGLVA